MSAIAKLLVYIVCSWSELSSLVTLTLYRSYFSLVIFCVFKTQLSVVSSLVDSLQKKCDELEIKNNQYSEKFTQCQVDREDILNYLQMLRMQKGLSCVNKICIVLALHTGTG